MTHTLKIDSKLYKALQESFGKKVLDIKLNDILLSGIENQLEKYNNQILNFEEKYGISFKEFEDMWDSGKIKDRHGYEVESDFIYRLGNA
ncbi:MAG: hypothetical protein GWN16_03410 [Calditrichae bacterium]|nr:hypothetical protein [Calditrichia bacterium]